MSDERETIGSIVTDAIANALEDELDRSHCEDSARSSLLLMLGGFVTGTCAPNLGEYFMAKITYLKSELQRLESEEVLVGDSYSREMQTKKRKLGSAERIYQQIAA